MGAVEICQCGFEALANDPHFAALTAEYASESALGGMPKPAAHFDTYKRLEASGAMRVLCAFQGQTLVGFIILLVALNPHYSVLLATTESFFVAEAHRKTGAGLKLLRTAEEIAAELGAAGFLISAPTGGRLERLLPHTGFHETNRVFFRSLR